MSAPTVVRKPDALQPQVKVALAFDWWRMAVPVADLDFRATSIVYGVERVPVARGG